MTALPVARLERNTIATAALLSTAAIKLPTDVASVGRYSKPTPSPRVSRPGAPPKQHPDIAASPVSDPRARPSHCFLSVPDPAAATHLATRDSTRSSTPSRPERRPVNLS